MNPKRKQKPTVRSIAMNVVLIIGAAIPFLLALYLASTLSDTEPDTRPLAPSPTPSAEMTASPTPTRPPETRRHDPRGGETAQITAAGEIARCDNTPQPGSPAQADRPRPGRCESG